MSQNIEFFLDIKVASIASSFFLAKLAEFFKNRQKNHPEVHEWILTSEQFLTLQILLMNGTSFWTRCDRFQLVSVMENPPDSSSSERAAREAEIEIVSTEPSGNTAPEKKCAYVMHYW